MMIGNSLGPKKVQYRITLELINLRFSGEIFSDSEGFQYRFNKLT